MIALRLALILPCLLLVQCAGYHLGGQKPGHLAEVTKLAIPTVLNETQEPRLSSVTTNALIKQIQMDGSYEITSEENADAVFKGRIERVNRSQFRSVRSNVLRTSQLQLQLYCTYTIEERSSGKVLHKGRASGISYVILDSNVQNSEAQTLDDAAQRLATTIANEIAEGW
jgi:hypothetical protein